MFLFLGLAVILTCYPHRLRWQEILAILILLNACSLVTEFVQEVFVPGRSFEWNDLRLNQVGIVFGVAAASALRFFATRFPRR